MRTLEEERAHKVLVGNEWKHIKMELKLQVGILVTWLATFWGVYLVNNVWFDNWIGMKLALEARSFDGLLGLLATPFLHLTWDSLIVNSILLVVLGWWVMLRDTRDFFMVHLTSMLTCGALVWLFEPSMVRWFGWGGVAMGMAGYLLTSGLFERRLATILSSLAAMAVLGTPVLAAITPGVANSWWGMAGGLLGGVMTAAFLGWRRRRSRNPDPEDYLGDRLPSASELAGFDKKSDTVFDFDARSPGKIHARAEVKQEVSKRG